ncbi:MAG TPA: nucleoside deaminase [Herpetosiphonaceae bacterium]|nr:nucleoside deaminase [Herpetosiphonaceae bacterium]
MCSEDEKHFMSLALMEAQAALTAGDYPVGAALVVNGELWATARNSLFSDARTTAHAEHNLLYSQSTQLRATVLRDPDAKVSLYTTLEPCLMCLGIAVLHRVSKIVIACPDPCGGTTSIDVLSLGSVYQRWWPEIHMGLFKEESCNLIIDFLKTEKFRSWDSMLNEFQTMKEQWGD